MTVDLEQIKQQIRQLLQDLQAVASLSSQHILVVGCSTSEVIGKNIGTSGTTEVAAAIFHELKVFHETTGVQLAFQGCEHINRALTVERKTAVEHRLDIVSVVPVPSAGGAMCAFAYRQLEDPVVVEFIKADAGIDIGDTFIGMHLKHVVVPIRSKINTIGHAHVTMATTRPKLIGGERAQYTAAMQNKSCSI